MAASSCRARPRPDHQLVGRHRGGRLHRRQLPRRRHLRGSVLRSRARHGDRRRRRRGALRVRRAGRARGYEVVAGDDPRLVARDRSLPRRLLVTPARHVGPGRSCLALRRRQHRDPRTVGRRVEDRRQARRAHRARVARHRGRGRDRRRCDRRRPSDQGTGGRARGAGFVRARRRSTSDGRGRRSDRDGVRQADATVGSVGRARSCRGPVRARSIAAPCVRG